MNALARAGAVVREFTLPEAEAAYAVFLQGSLSAIELCSFLAHVLFADQSQSIPDNLVALFGRIGAWNYSTETARSAVKVSTEALGRLSDDNLTVPW